MKRYRANLKKRASYLPIGIKKICHKSFHTPILKFAEKIVTRVKTGKYIYVS